MVKWLAGLCTDKKVIKTKSLEEPESEDEDGEDREVTIKKVITKNKAQRQPLSRPIVCVCNDLYRSY